MYNPNTCKARQGTNQNSRNKPKPPPGYAYVSTEVLVPIQQETKPKPKPQVTKTTYVTNYVIQGESSVSTNASKLPHVFRPHHPPYKPNPTIIHTKPAKFNPVPRQPIFTSSKKFMNRQDMAGINWVQVDKTSAQHYASTAVVGGYEGWDRSPLWVIRARHGNELIPGKFAAKHNAVYVPFNGAEVPVERFDVLCAPPNSVHWLPSSNGSVPPNAVPGGQSATGQLFIGRAHHNNSLTPGKVHPSHSCCYISFGGKEVSLKSYEVLCRK